MNDEKDLNEISPKKMLACNVVAAAVVVAAGLFLLLCGLGVVPVKVTRAIVGTLLCAVGLGLLVTALIQGNSVSLWLACCFLVPALCELLVKATALGYREIYPLYIAIPAVASLFTMCMTHEWRTHLSVAGLFGVPAGLFALNSAGVAGWSVVLPLLVVFLGTVMLLLAILRHYHRADD